MPRPKHQGRKPSADAATHSAEKGVRPSIAATELPFETAQLRSGLSKFLGQDFILSGKRVRLGSVVWGVYAFYDYDGEPIYVGQTKERLGSRIRRHLTNQRTDAVAMNVLDPFEVHSIAVWPLPDYQRTAKSDPKAIAVLNALEHHVFQLSLSQSKFNAVLNEKDPPLPTVDVAVPKAIHGAVVSDEVASLRDHPDLRIARRAATLAKLAQVISERKVGRGLRRTLLAQARRLNALAEERYKHAADIDENEDDE